jgi:transposase
MLAFLFKITLSTKEKEYLENALQLTVKDIIARKARVLLFFNRGATVEKASNAYGLSTKTSYRYIDAFENTGVEGLLKYKCSQGRHSRLPDNIADIIIDVLKRSPNVIHSLDTAYHNWTIELMQSYLL